MVNEIGCLVTEEMVEGVEVCERGVGVMCSWYGNMKSGNEEGLMDLQGARKVAIKGEGKLGYIQ